MSLLAEFAPWWRFAFALLIAALIGLEREFYQQEVGNPDFAGIRTFSLISLLGAATAFLVPDYEVIFAVLALAGWILIFIPGKKAAPAGRDTQADFKIGNPLKLLTAIKFGLLFAIVLVVIEFALNSLGSTWAYFTSLLTGLTDVNAITLSATRPVSNNQIKLQAASLAVVSAALTNTLFRSAISPTYLARRN